MKMAGSLLPEFEKKKRKKRKKDEVEDMAAVQEKKAHVETKDSAAALPTEEGSSKGGPPPCLLDVPAISDFGDSRLPYQPLWSRVGRERRPTAIQQKAWPAALRGRDVVGVAPTGSGKTLAYLLPAACRARDEDGRALVLAPTRELASQISSVAKIVAKAFPTTSSSSSSLGKKNDVSAVVLVAGGGGEATKDEQRSALGGRSFLVVATPGRLLDLLFSDDDPSERKNNFLFRCVVVDEADKMVGKKGFEKDLEAVYAAVVAKKKKNVVSGKKTTRKSPSHHHHHAMQHLLFTATFPAYLRESALPKFTVSSRLDVLLHDDDAAVTGVTGVVEDVARIPAHVEQRVHVCARHKRSRLLLRFLDRVAEVEARQAVKVLVFANTTQSVREVRDLVGRHGRKAAAIWGALPQKERDARFLAFRAGKVPILVATDLVARGLHLTHLPVVVNWDAPTSLDAYAHRVGRVGRDLDDHRKQRALEAKGRSGEHLLFSPDSCVALTFFTRNLRKLAPALLRLLRQTHQRISPELVELAGSMPQTTTTQTTTTHQEEPPAAPSSSASKPSSKKKQRRRPPKEPSFEVLEDDDVDSDVLAALRAAV